jgi:nucleotide-binding universal stress UspA family protein
MRKLLLAVDGSKSSHKAAMKAADLATAMDCEITIITVLDLSSLELSEIQSYRPIDSLEDLIKRNKSELQKSGEHILEEAEKHFKEKEIEVNKVLEYGDPADMICEYAENNDFDIIVLADKGMGGVKRFFLGSISDKVIRHANTSVLVVK